MLGFGWALAARREGLSDRAWLEKVLPGAGEHVVRCAEHRGTERPEIRAYDVTLSKDDGTERCLQVRVAWVRLNGERLCGYEIVAEGRDWTRSGKRSGTRYAASQGAASQGAASQGPASGGAAQAGRRS